MNWLDARLQEIFVTVGIGVSIGTVWRMVMRPETNVQQFVVRAFMCLTVGLVAGMSIAEWANFSRSPAVGVGFVTGFLSEEILLFCSGGA